MARKVLENLQVKTTALSKLQQTPAKLKETKFRKSEEHKLLVAMESLFESLRKGNTHLIKAAARLQALFKEPEELDANGLLAGDLFQVWLVLLKKWRIIGVLFVCFLDF